LVCCDILIIPTALGEAFKIGSKASPIDAYKEDVFTISANVVGIPSLSIPFGKGANGMPLGIQIMANKFDEAKILSLAKLIEDKIGE